MGTLERVFWNDQSKALCVFHTSSTFGIPILERKKENLPYGNNVDLLMNTIIANLGTSSNDNATWDVTNKNGRIDNTQTYVVVKRHLRSTKLHMWRRKK